MSSSMPSSPTIAPSKLTADQQYLMAHLLGISRAELFRKKHYPASKELLEGFLQLEKGEPLAYLIGWVPFGGLKIRCDARALAPRIETEELIQIFIDKTDPKEGEKLCDVCCGTGALGLALKHRFNQLEVTLTDLSEAALSLARENAQGMDVQLIQGDLVVDQLAHYVICNPPYLTEEEYSRSLLGSEPKEALVAGDRGTEFYERLAGKLPRGALVFLEIGHTQGDFIKKLFDAEILCDHFGLDRFAFFKNLV